MTILVNHHGYDGPLADYLDRLELLISDLQNLQRGIFPAPTRLACAPLIDRFIIGVRTDPCLIGEIHGHPHLRSPHGVTSSLWLYAPELGWARTLSRFYRLGRPAGAGSQS
jgi:hypothetical protein